jgi:hypothetical protein
MSPFEKLPEELLLRIAECLAEDVCPSEPEDKANYNELLSFCYLNKTCRRAGQEALVRHCDLTIRPRCQVFFLVRTLLAKPALAAKIQSLKISPRSSSVAEFPKGQSVTMEELQDQLHFTTLKVAERKELSTQMIQHVRPLDIDKYLKFRWIESLNVDVCEMWAGICLLLLLANKIRSLALDNVLLGEDLYKIKQLVNEKTLDILSQVNTLCIRMKSAPVCNAVRFLFSDPWLMQFPKLLTLELYSHRLLADGHFSPQDKSPSRYLLGKIPMRSCPVRNLLLSGWFERDWLMPLFERFESLQSFSYNVRCEGYPRLRPLQALPKLPGIPNPHEELASLWMTMLPHKGSLESIKIDVQHCGDFTLDVSTRNLSQYSSLKILELSGNFTFGALVPTAGTYPDVSLLFPPSIQHLTFAPADLGIRWFSLGEDGHFANFTTAFEHFLPKAKVIRPTLKSLILGGAKDFRSGKVDDYRYFDEELLEMMEGGVVYLIKRKAWKTDEGFRAKLQDEEGKDVFDFCRSRTVGTKGLPDLGDLHVDDSPETGVSNRVFVGE